MNGIHLHLKGKRETYGVGGGRWGDREGHILTQGFLK